MREAFVVFGSGLNMAKGGEGEINAISFTANDCAKDMCSPMINAAIYFCEQFRVW